MTPEIAALKAKLDAHRAKCPDLLKSLDPKAPKHVRSAYREWREEHEQLEMALNTAQWKHRSAWKDAQGGIVRPLGWRSTGELLSSDDVPPKSVAPVEPPPKALDMLRRLRQRLADLDEYDPTSQAWRDARESAASLRCKLVRQAKDEELLIDIPKVPLRGKP